MTINKVWTLAEMVKINDAKKYKFGTIIQCGDIKGEVVAHYQYRDTNYVMWEDGGRATYDDLWLDENVTVVSIPEW